RLNLCVGNQSAAGVVPLIQDKGPAVDVLNNTLSYSEANGFSVISSNAFIDTGVHPATDMASLTNDAHLSIYLGGTAGTGLTIPIGISSTDSFFLTASYAGLGQVTDIWTFTGRPVA